MAKIVAKIYLLICRYCGEKAEIMTEEVNFHPAREVADLAGEIGWQATILKEGEDVCQSCLKKHPPEK